MQFGTHVLTLDPEAETEHIVSVMRKTIQQDFRRRGAIVGLSGGIDSATVLGLTVKAFGSERVLAVMMPEQASSPISEEYAQELADKFGVTAIKEDLTAGLEGFGCYDRQDAAVRSVFPDYDPATDKIKLVLPNDLLDRGSLNVYSLSLTGANGEERRRVLPVAAYLKIVAASNMKQRSRMLMLYYHAEERNYAVIGTANRNEHAQGFFVKYGDGGADIQPIQHLYKTQIYQLARYLGVTQAIIDRTPTTDTYSAEQSQEEFYYRLPFELMDLIWYGLDNNIPAADVASALAISAQQVENVYRDLTQKSRSTEYLRAKPLMVR
ncbi:MAG: NAD(+) synthase [Oscillochloris sp.]|nr:NAD(+) synthase [Oscillochloris sp.]